MVRNRNYNNKLVQMRPAGINSLFTMFSNTAASALVAIFSLSLVACGGGGGGEVSTPSSCTPANVTNLAVTSINPAITENDVSVNSSVAVTFNTCIDTSTVSNSTFIVTGGSLPLSGNYVFDGDTYTLTFTPSSALAYDRPYIVAILTGLTGSNGERLLNDYSSSFFTRAAPDVTAPSTTASPAGGSYNTPQLVSLICDDGATGTGCAKTYYTLNNSTPTTNSAVYTSALNLSSNLTLKYFSVDVDGNAEAVQSQQYIIDIIPPEVTATTPDNATTGVVLTAELSVTFSEQMDTATLTDTNITVDNGVTGAISYDDTTFTLSFAPYERLACNTLHSLTIGTGVTDLAANNMLTDYVATFTTHTDCDAPVTTASVEAGVYKTAQSVTLSCDDGAGSGCAKMVYTTDGSVPSFSPLNGTLVTAATAGPITITTGDTQLQYFSEDNAGNRDVLRKQLYSVSTNGFTFVATNIGLMRGVGTAPTEYVTIKGDGKVNRFFQDETNNRFYKATDSGIYYSDDNGQHWEHISIYWEYYSSYQSVNGIYAKGNKIYAATRDGIFVSTDSGATFEKRHPEGTNTNWCINVVASGPNVYAACTGGSTYYDGSAVSSDKGQTFSIRTTADGLGTEAGESVYTEGNTLYVATSKGLAISTDNGASFTNKTAAANGLGSDDVNDVVAVGSRVYAATSAGLSISTDGGNTFTNKTTADGLAGNLVAGMTVSGTSVYLSHFSSISISHDSGVSFINRLFDPMASAEAIAYRGSNLYLGSYPSYYESSNEGVSFTRKGLPTGFIGDIAIASDNTVYVIANDSSGYESLAWSTDGGRTFSVKDYRDWGAFSSYIDDLYVDGTDVYLTGSGLTKSTDGAVSFSHYTTTDGLTANSTNAVYADGSTVYVNTSNSIDVSTDAGQTYSLLLGSSGSASDNPGSMYAQGNDIYLATSSGLQLSHDAGASFSLATTTQGLPSNYLTGLAVDSAGDLYVTTLNDGLAKSTDKGASFTSLTTGNRAMMCNNTLYVGDGGLKISTDGGVSFSRLITFDQYTRVAAACYMP